MIPYEHYFNCPECGENHYDDLEIDQWETTNTHTFETRCKCGCMFVTTVDFFATMEIDIENEKKKIIKSGLDKSNEGPVFEDKHTGDLFVNQETNSLSGSGR